MNKDITINQKCILMRSGAEIWIEEKKFAPLVSLLEKQKFIKIDNEVINTAEITGIYEAKTLEDIRHRKNGEWKDNKGQWHQRGEKVCKCGNVIPFGKTCGYCKT